ncbi:abortive phage resistance protein [Kytococcus sp. CUA-901]|nr:abortive phage resistance protein [Kytococcus sp. CUA-901]
MKPWLPWPDQLSLLQERGLRVGDEAACQARLSTVNYYRFAGYARFFQVAPHQGNNRFHEGTTFEDVLALYEADADLRTRLMPLLGEIEVMLRTQYAYVVGRDVGPRGDYLDDSFFSGAETSESLSDACRKDLDRSRERFILRYRDRNAPDPYATLPVWSAVEALSFGTLSKCIERADGGNLHRALAEELGVARTGFVSRVRALVYLRNRCAHHARLWRHSVVDAGATPNNIKHRAKKAVGNFDPRSILDVLVSLDDFMAKAALDGQVVTPLVSEYGRDSLFVRGLREPQGHRDGGRV